MHSTMCEDTDDSLPNKTWSRLMQPVTKVGYMDGASDGRKSVFQDSFNMAYEQGLKFGMELGFKNATSSVQCKSTPKDQILQDTRQINCQICINGVPTQENIGNLYNNQEEKNTEILAML